MGKKQYDPLWRILDENVALQGAEPDVDVHCPYCHVIVHVGLKGKVGDRYECGLCGGVSELCEQEEWTTLDRRGGKLGEGEKLTYFAWFRCQECRMVSQQDDLSRPYMPCPTCGASSQARTIWPPAETKPLLSSVLDHDLSDQEEKVAAIVSATTFLEILLDDALRNLLQRDGASYELRARLFGEVESVDGRLSIVEQLLGTEVEDIAAELGVGWFMDEWKSYRQMRRNAVHGVNLPTSPSDLQKGLERIMLAGEQVFAEVNKRTWMEEEASDLEGPSVFLRALDEVGDRSRLASSQSQASLRPSQS
jgi:hypothetical protein